MMDEIWRSFVIFCSTKWRERKTPTVWLGVWELPSLKLTWPLKMDGWNTSFLLGWPIFRGYVSFRGCRGFCLFIDPLPGRMCKVMMPWHSAWVLMRVRCNFECPGVEWLNGFKWQGTKNMSRWQSLMDWFAIHKVTFVCTSYSPCPACNCHHQENITFLSGGSDEPSLSIDFHCDQAHGIP